MKKTLTLLSLFIFAFPLLTRAEPINEYDEVTLSKCVDSTSARFMLGQNEIKVKFLGIDATVSIITSEEDEINGSEVDSYVCSTLENAENIKIEYEPNSNREDKYGRLLVWVHVDDVLLQEHLVEQGYAKVAFLYNDYTYNNELKNAEQIAKENKTGIWHSEEAVDTNIADEEVENDESKSIFSQILNFINEIFEKLLKFIDDLINDML